MLACVFIVALHLSALAIGWPLVSRARLPWVSRAFRVAASWALGLGLVGLLAFALGHCGLLRAAVIWPCLAAGVLAFVLQFDRHARAGLTATGAWFASLGLLGRVCLALLGGLGVVAFLLAFCPPTMWDALSIHLQMAKRWATDGSLAYHRSPFYILFQLIDAVALACAGQSAALLVGTSSWAASGLLLYGAARRYCSAEGALVAATLYCSSHLFSYASQGYVDIDQSLLLMAALLLLLEARHTQRAGFVILAFAMLGFAILAKITALMYLPLAALLAMLFLPGNWTRRALTVGAACLLAATIVSPLLLRNWAHYGSPTGMGAAEMGDQPSLFSLERLPPMEASSLRGKVTAWFGNNHLAWTGLRHPGDAPRFLVPVAGYYRLAGLALLLYWGRIWKDPARKPLLLTFLAAILVAFAMTGQLRFWYGPLGLLAVVLGAALDGPKRLGAVLIVATVLLQAPLWAPKTIAEKLQVSVGLCPAEALLSARVRGYEALQWLNDNASGDAKVLTYSALPYYLDREYIRSDDFGRMVDVREASTTEGMLVILRREGVTHIVRDAAPRWEAIPLDRARVVAVQWPSLDGEAPGWGNVIAALLDDLCDSDLVQQLGAWDNCSVHAVPPASRPPLSSPIPPTY